MRAEVARILRWQEKVAEAAVSDDLDWLRWHPDQPVRVRYPISGEFSAVHPGVVADLQCRCGPPWRVGVRKTGPGRVERVPVFWHHVDRGWEWCLGFQYWAVPEADVHRATLGYWEQLSALAWQNIWLPPSPVVGVPAPGVCFPTPAPGLDP